MHAAQLASAAPCTPPGLLHHAFRQLHVQSLHPALAAPPQAAGEQQSLPCLSQLTATGTSCAWPARQVLAVPLLPGPQPLQPQSHCSPYPCPADTTLYLDQCIHVSACVLPLTPLRLSWPSGASCITTTRTIARPDGPLLLSCTCTCRCPALHLQAAPWQRGHHLSRHATTCFSKPCPLSLQARAVP